MNSSKNLLEYTSLIEEILPIYIELYFSKSRKAANFWDRLKSSSQCYVYGGFIVDFLRRKKSHRDIDIVIDSFNKPIINLIKKHSGLKNSFGGYKLNIDGVIVDIWAISDTWAIKKMNSLNFDLFATLPSTSFFNSTAIVYSVNEKRLIYNKRFLNYINNKNLEILFEENPYPELCIIKSYQNYNEGIKLSTQLKKYIIRKFRIASNNFDSIQLSHFGEVRYTSDELIDFYKQNLLDLSEGKATPEDYIPATQLSFFG